MTTATNQSSRQQEQAASQNIMIQIACLSCFPALYLIGKLAILLAG